MKRHLLMNVLLLGLFSFSTAGAARAESWLFQQSYYSHDPVTQVRIGRQYSEGPVFTRPVGEYIQSGWRYNRSTITIRGQVFDNLNLWESWYQTGAKF